MAKLVTYKHPQFGTTMRTTVELRDRILGKTARPGPEILSQDDTAPAYVDIRQLSSPAANGSTAEWREYRLANGYTEADLVDLGRDDLRDLDDR